MGGSPTSEENAMKASNEMDEHGNRATDNLVLSDGVRIPRLGLGLFRMARGESTRSVVGQALSLGYRHFDTARVYGNEADVAAAIRASGIERNEVFVTTKLWNDDQGFDAALRAYDAMLTRTGLESVDLFLLHWPVPGKRLESWRALERIYKEGRVRAIGVSNFMVRHLEELLAHCEIRPSVNQIEVSPFLQQIDVRAYCAEHGIAVAAYSPLTKGLRLSHPVVAGIAASCGRTPAQVLLRWGLARDLIVLPKSTHPSRLAENFAALHFELGVKELEALDALDEGLVTGWDPREVP
jgi:diketogulonate reductase-like aldo/keto reductase